MATPAVAALMAMAPTAARAADLYWDINGATAGASDDATAAGTWNAANTNWTSDSTGSSATVAWNANDIAIFSAGENATDSFTVTVEGTQSVGGITFEDQANSTTRTLTGGTLDLTGSATIHAAQTSPSVRQVINSTITGSAGLTRTSGVTGGVGGPILELGGDNTYTGVTTIGVDAPTNLAGTIRVSHANALGAGGPGNGVIFGAGTASNAANASVSQLQLTNNIKIANEEITLNSGGGRNQTGQLTSFSGTNTWGGNITINGWVNNEGTGLASIGASPGATLVVEGVISNPAGKTTADNGTVWGKNGDGTVVLRNANTFINWVRILDGILQVEADGALGTASVPGVLQGSTLFNALNSNHTPTLVFNAPPTSPAGFNYSTYEVITTGANNATTSGLGVGGRGLIHNQTGDNTFAGDIRFGGAFVSPKVVTSIGADAGGSLELSGRLFASAGPAPSPREIHKVGAGEIIISGLNDGTDGVTSGGPEINWTQFALHGDMIIEEGQVTLRSADPTKGNLLGNSIGPVNFQVKRGGTLSLDNSLAVNTQRIAPTATIALEAGEVKLVGNPTTSVNQAAGNLTVASYSTITVDQPTNMVGATATFSLGTLNRNSRGTALLRGINNTSGKMELSGTLIGGDGAAGTPEVSILPPVVGDASPTGDGTDFVTIDGGFARPLTASEYTALVSGNTTLVNTTIVANTNVSADTTVNSIKMNGGNTLTIDPASKVLVRSGALLGVGAGTSTITGGTLTFEDATIFEDEFGNTSLIVNSVEEGIITVPEGSNLVIASTLGGGEGITKSGNGVLTLSGNNTYGQLASGKTTINAGVLEFSVDANLGNPDSEVVLNGGTLRPLASSVSTRGIELGSLGTNAIEVGPGATFEVTGTVSSPNAAGAALTKLGDGELMLSNASNSYSGGTIIQGGTITTSAPGQLGSGNVQLNGGGLRVTADGTYTNPVVVNNSAAGIAVDPGVTAVFSGLLTGPADLQLNGGGIFNPTANNLYTGNNIITNGSTLKYTVSQGLGSAPTFTPGYFTLDNGRILTEGQGTGGIGTYSSNRGITLGAGGGTLEATLGSATAPYLLTFPMVISGAGNLTVKPGADTIIAIGGANTYVGDTIIPSGEVRVTGQLGAGNQLNDGVLDVRGAGPLGGVSGSGNLLIGDGTAGVTVTANHVRQNALEVKALSTLKMNADSSAAGTSKVNDLTMAADAKLDLAANKLIVQNGTAGTATGGVYDGLQGLVQSGYAGGAWNGNGINSSSAAAIPAGEASTAIGVATGAHVNPALSTPGNTALFGGQTITGSSVIAMYTYGGDANLDGLVSGDDYTAIDFAIAVPGASGWVNGDFNYDGIISGDDYTVIDFNIAAQGAAFPTSGAASGVTAVPEPASLSVVALGAMSLLGRRRRK